MLGILAVILFALAFFFHGAGFANGPWLDSTSLALLGLVCLALHLLGVGAGISIRRQP